MTTATTDRGRHRRPRSGRAVPRTLVVTGLAVALVSGSGIAWGAWSASGSGSVGARAVTAKASAVTAGTPAALLYPRPSAGYPSTGPGTITFAVDNPNPYPVTFTGLTLGAVTSGDPANCPAASVTAATPAPAFSLQLPANAAATTVTVPGALSMAIDAPSGCQGVLFTVAVTLTGTSATS